MSVGGGGDDGGSEENKVRVERFVSRSEEQRISSKIKIKIKRERERERAKQAHVNRGPVQCVGRC